MDNAFLYLVRILDEDRDHFNPSFPHGVHSIMPSQPLNAQGPTVRELDGDRAGFQAYLMSIFRRLASRPNYETAS